MKKRTIGVVLESDFEYGVAVFEGIRQAVDNIPEWRLVPVMQSQQGFLTRLSQAGELDGIIAPAISDRWVESYSRSNPAFVNISNISKVETLSSVVIDDRAAGAMVARHFTEMSIKRVGVVAEKAVYSSRLRKDGFCDELKEGEIELPSSEGGYSYEGEWEAWLRMLEGEIAIFGTSDRLARRFMNLYNKIKDGLQVNVGVVAGIGDSLIERTLSGIDLSSVVLPAKKVGVEAVRLMQNMLGGDLEVVHLKIKPDDLIIRRSSAGYTNFDEFMVKALGYIDRMLAGRLSVDDLARFSGASRRKLEMCFQRELGMAPAAYIRRKRSVLAERLLKESRLTIRQIALRCGAGTLQAFTAQFKQVHGVPPGAFRDEKHACGLEVAKR
ncbi:MAG: helix-turn-helix domain-containing protein [Kiritimatiellae bacterium]|nr:helix-turn-helix domain-containing protein [Kiritimatiellia bacterium]